MKVNEHKGVNPSSKLVVQVNEDEKTGVVVNRIRADDDFEIPGCVLISDQNNFDIGNTVHLTEDGWQCAESEPAVNDAGASEL